MHVSHRAERRRVAMIEIADLQQKCRIVVGDPAIDGSGNVGVRTDINQVDSHGKRQVVAGSGRRKGSELMRGRLLQYPTRINAVKVLRVSRQARKRNDRRKIARCQSALRRAELRGGKSSTR